MNKLANFIASVSGATENDFIERLEELSKPENFSKSELGSKWEEAIGYNPIDFHDEQFLDDIFDELIEDAPFSVKENLIGKKEALIKDALEKRNEHSEAYLTNMLISSIYEETGWLNKKELVDFNEFMDEINLDEDELDEDEDEEEFYDELEDLDE